MKFPEIETRNFNLRRFAASDVNEVFRALGNPQVTKYYGVHYNSLEDCNAQMEYFNEVETSGKGFWWAVCNKDGILLGAAGLYQHQPQHRKAETGFWLLPEYHRQGIMHEVMPAICLYGFYVMKLRRIEAFVEKGNEASVLFLQELGFKNEGLMRDAEIKNGAFISIHVFSLLASEHQFA